MSKPFPTAAEQAARPTYENEEAEALAYTEHIQAQHEADEQQAIAANIARAIERFNEGTEPCSNGTLGYCDGKGRVETIGEECGYCQQIESQIDAAGEPD